MNAFRVLLGYYIFYYGLPILAIVIFGIDTSEKYNSSLNIISVSTVILVAALVGSIVYVKSKTPRIYLASKSVFKIVRLITFIFVIATFTLALNFYSDYGISFRHTTRLNSLPLGTRLTFVLLPFIVANSFYLSLSRGHSLRKALFTRILVLTVAVEMFLLSTASFDYIVIFLLIAFTYDLDVWFVNISLRKRLILILFLLPIFILSIVIFGLSNKIGLDRTLGLIGSTDGVGVVFEELILRLSVSLFSAFNYDLASQVNVYNIIFNQNIDYLMKILGESTQPYGINRQNFLILFKDAKTTSISGASPGLIGSVMYFESLIPGIFIFSNVFLIVFRLIDKLTKYVSHNVFKILLFYMLFTSYIDSFYQLMNMFNPTLYLLLWSVFLSKRV